MVGFNTGECPCEDGTVCRFEDGVGDENCPCGKWDGPKRKGRRGRVHQGL